jgi:PPP family 3-phenylpropionic acid transporter
MSAAAGTDGASAASAAACSEVGDVPAAAPAPAQESAPDDAALTAYAGLDRFLLRHRLVYFFGTLVIAAYYPFVVQLWTAPDGANLGLSEAGGILGGAHIAAALASPLLAGLADRGEFWRRVMIVGGFTAQGAAIALAGYARGWPSILALHAIAEVAGAGVWPLVDAATSRLTSSVPRSPSYGAVRVFASVGWGGGAFASGALYDFAGRRAAFGVAVAAAAAAAALVLNFPIEKRAANNSQRVTAIRSLAVPRVALFVAAVTVSAALNAAVDSFRGPFLENLGADDTLVGISLAASAFSEVPAFLIAPAIIERFGESRALATSLLAFGMRYFVLDSLSGSSRGAGFFAAVIAGDILHGAAFALSWTAAVAYFSQLFPPELAASAQAILAMLQWGAGAAAGAASMGAAAHAWGWGRAWRLGGSVASAAGLLAFILSWCDAPPLQRRATPGIEAFPLHSRRAAAPVADGWDTRSVEMNQN